DVAHRMHGQRVDALARSLAPDDPGVGGVVVDRLEVFRFDDETLDSRIGGEPRRDAARQILDEFRVVVGALGHVLLVGALEQPVELAGRFLLADANDLAQEYRRARRHGDRYGRALVVRSVLGDLLRAWTKRRHRDRDLDR